MQSSRGTEGLREARGERRQCFVSRGSGTEREARGGERREGDVLGLKKKCGEEAAGLLRGCREQR